MGFEAGFSLIGERPLAMAPGITKQGAGGDAGLNWGNIIKKPGVLWIILIDVMT